MDAGAVYRPEHYCASLLKNLAHLRSINAFCDVTLTVQEAQFRAHRTILAAASPYFQVNLLNWHWTLSFELSLHPTSIKTNGEPFVLAWCNFPNSGLSRSQTEPEHFWPGRRHFCETRATICAQRYTVVELVCGFFLVKLPSELSLDGESDRQTTPEFLPEIFTVRFNFL